MNKRGMEAVPLVISLILGLIVLVIIALLVRQQITKQSGQYNQIGEEAGSLGGCSNLFLGRGCFKSQCPPDKQPESPSSGWADCTKKGADFLCCKQKEATA